jgi:hypothetical protein
MFSLRLHGVASALLLIAGTALYGCQSTPVPEDMPPVVELPFEPAVPSSTIQWAKGRYPNVYGSGSFAVWVDEDVSELKRADAVKTGETLDETAVMDAEAIQRQFYVLELHLVSRFADASAAYDAVGLRNIDVYLQTPEGNKVRPVQRIMGPPATETPVEALRQYTRTSILLFPKNDALRNRPSVSSRQGSVRLHLSAFNSEYYFEWPGVEPTSPAQDAPHPSRLNALQRKLSEKESYQVLSMRFNELYDRLRRGTNRGGVPSP